METLVTLFNEIEPATLKWMYYSAKPKCSICSLHKSADTAFWLCIAAGSAVDSDDRDIISRESKYSESNISANGKLPWINPSARGLTSKVCFDVVSSAYFTLKCFTWLISGVNEQDKDGKVYDKFNAPTGLQDLAVEMAHDLTDPVHQLAWCETMHVNLHLTHWECSW